MTIKSQNDIVKRYKQAIFYLMSNECKQNWGKKVKTFHTIRELYWVLGGEGACPIQLFPKTKILDKEKLYNVI